MFRRNETKINTFCSYELFSAPYSVLFVVTRISPNHDTRAASVAATNGQQRGSFSGSCFISNISDHPDHIVRVASGDVQEKEAPP